MPSLFLIVFFFLCIAVWLVRKYVKRTRRWATDNLGLVVFVSVRKWKSWVLLNQTVWVRLVTSGNFFFLRQELALLVAEYGHFISPYCND